MSECVSVCVKERKRKMWNVHSLAGSRWPALSSVFAYINSWSCQLFVIGCCK